MAVQAIWSTASLVGRAPSRAMLASQPPAVAELYVLDIVATMVVLSSFSNLPDMSVDTKSQSPSSLELAFYIIGGVM